MCKICSELISLKFIAALMYQLNVHQLTLFFMETKFRFPKASACLNHIFNWLTGKHSLFNSAWN